MNRNTKLKKILSLFVFLLLVQVFSPLTTQAQPPYAKWGRMAMIETQRRYPNADIVDYLHVGRRTISPSVTEEKFKLWLKEGRREFGVFVTIQFQTRTEEVKSIQFRETNR